MYVSIILGIEAQTVTVWKQAKHYSIPAIFFLNKMDKLNANFGDSVNSIQEKLGLQPLILQVNI